MTLVTNTYTADESYDDYSKTNADSEFGSEGDTWGNTWTAEKLNDPSFEVLFDVDLTGTTGTLRADSVSVEVFYVLPRKSTPGGGKFSATSFTSCAIGQVSGATRIVAVGAKGMIYTSDDQGATWTERSSQTTELLWKVTYGDGQFVAVGNKGVVRTSSDGATWSISTSYSSENLFAVSVDPEQKAVIAAGRNEELRRKPRGAAWGIKRL